MIFQSTLRRTERLILLVYVIPPRHFNPRSDERSDCLETGIILNSWIFQSTLRRTERPVQHSSTAQRKYFNPRSDERSDDTSYNTNLINTDISIHAPTNGATLAAGAWWIARQISIHAPTNGATKCPKSDACEHWNFNPRSDERSDRKWQSLVSMTFYFNPRSDERSDIRGSKAGRGRAISIHAPTNGATAILHKKMKKTIQNRLIILLFSTNSLRLLCSCTQYSFFLFIFHGANDLVILCSLSFRTTSKN